MITLTITALIIALIIAAMDHFGWTGSAPTAAVSSAALVVLIWTIPGATVLVSGFVGFALLGALWAFTNCAIRWAHRLPMPTLRIGMISDGQRTGLAFAVAI